MTSHSLRKSIGTAAALALTITAGMFLSSQRGLADGGHDDNDSSVKANLALAPVPLKLAGKNIELVARGSYLVNAVGECYGCHSAGPETEYAPGGNPYFNQKPMKVNPATYMGGGRDFGAFPAAGPFPHIISRNLTPDKSGKPLGGDSYADFLKIIRTGADPDLLHPTCTTPTPNGKCLPPPFDGSLLQVMPWPAYRSMTDADLRAIYEYLSAIPCVVGPGDSPSRCK